jgi:hypothetical protein
VVEDIKGWILDRGESYHVQSNNKSRMVLVCLDNNICDFRVRVSISTAQTSSRKPRLSVYIPHKCPPHTHEQDRFKDRQASWYISRNHSFSIARNLSIKPKQVVDAEAIRRHGTISTRQARRRISLGLDKLDGFEDDSFGLFPSYVAELKAVGPNTYAAYRLNDTTNAFQAVVR